MVSPNPNLSSSQFASVPAQEKAPQAPTPGWSTYWPEPLIKSFKPITPPNERKWHW